MTDQATELKRQEIVERLRTIRGSYLDCVSDVSSEIANRGSEWAIVDLLRHVTGSYRGMISRILEEDNPDLGGAYDPEAAWKRVVDNLLKDVDAAISTASEMTIEQLGRSGQRQGKSIGVLDVLELIADHHDEHLAQLTNEVRPREGLAGI